LGLSQEELSRASGVPISTLKKYEANERVPGGDALAGLARAGINLAKLLIGREDSPGQAAHVAEPIAGYVNLAVNWNVMSLVLAGVDRLGAAGEERLALIELAYEYVMARGTTDQEALSTFLSRWARSVPTPRPPEKQERQADQEWPLMDRRHVTRRKTDAK